MLANRAETMVDTAISGQVYCAPAQVYSRPDPQVRVDPAGGGAGAASPVEAADHHRLRTSGARSAACGLNCPRGARWKSRRPAIPSSPVQRRAVHRPTIVQP